ncbi:MAG: T9SS type A sorting domain-containing protein [candidate division WOR-3 bacterium]
MRWRCPAPLNNWQSLTNTDYEQYPGAAIAHGRDNWVYAFFGSTNTAFAKHWRWERFDGGEQAAGSTGSPALGLTVYPNPVANIASIRFAQPEAGWCRVVVYDVTGTAVRQLVDDFLPAGSHLLSWDRRSDSGDEVPAGIYVVRVRTGQAVEAAKLAVK